MICRSRRVSVVCSFCVIVLTRIEASRRRPRNVIFITLRATKITLVGAAVKPPAAASRRRGKSAGRRYSGSGVVALVPRARESRRPSTSTPRRTATALALGVGLSFSPLLGLQILIGFGATLAFRLSRVAVLIGPLRERAVDHAAVVRAHDGGRGGAPRHHVDRWISNERLGVILSVPFYQRRVLGTRRRSARGVLLAVPHRTNRRGPGARRAHLRRGAARADASRRAAARGGRARRHQSLRATQRSELPIGMSTTRRARASTRSSSAQQRVEGRRRQDDVGAGFLGRRQPHQPLPGANGEHQRKQQTRSSRSGASRGTRRL